MLESSEWHVSTLHVHTLDLIAVCGLDLRNSFVFCVCAYTSRYVAQLHVYSFDIKY